MSVSFGVAVRFDAFEYQERRLTRSRHYRSFCEIEELELRLTMSFDAPLVPILWLERVVVFHFFIVNIRFSIIICARTSLRSFFLILKKVKPCRNDVTTHESRADAVFVVDSPLSRCDTSVIWRVSVHLEESVSSSRLGVKRRQPRIHYSLFGSHRRSSCLLEFNHYSWPHKIERIMNRFQFALLFLCSAAIHATPAPRPATQSMTTSPASLFGVPQRIPALQVRGGGGSVLEPDTLDDVESILLKAGAESKLVVIDFTATWYVVAGRIQWFQLSCFY